MIPPPCSGHSTDSTGGDGEGGVSDTGVRRESLGARVRSQVPIFTNAEAIRHRPLCVTPLGQNRNRSGATLFGGRSEDREGQQLSDPAGGHLRRSGDSRPYRARGEGGQSRPPRLCRFPGAARLRGDDHRGETPARGICEDIGGRGGAEQFAVRSSGTAEDLEGASFAGQYETFLDVRIDDLPAAVGRVFDSACASGVSAYRDARTELTGETAPSMAVLVQVMVGADSAGVAFTANPVTGERGEIVITAVRGLGERLVSGDEWVVRGDGASCRRES